jgi:hypothetical protein
MEILKRLFWLIIAFCILMSAGLSIIVFGIGLWWRALEYCILKLK